MTKALFENNESSSEDLDYGDRSDTGSENSSSELKVGTLEQMTYNLVNLLCKTVADAVTYTDPQSHRSTRVFILPPTATVSTASFLMIATVPNPLPSAMQSVSSGWKFHIRVAPTPAAPGELSNLERSWPIMLEVLNRHGVASAKIIREVMRTTLANDPKQCFKTYTIYPFKDQRPAAAWLPILIEIEQRLTAADIQPAVIPITESSGTNPNREFVIPNSRFCSYRNDGSAKIANPYHSFSFPAPAPSTNLGNDDDDGYHSANDNDDGPPTLGS